LACDLDTYQKRYRINLNSHNREIIGFKETSIERRQCDLGNCNIETFWTSWSIWSSCSATCGSGGLRTRYRYCISHLNTLSVNCVPGARSSLDMESQKCSSFVECSDQYSQWEKWSSCLSICYLQRKTIKKRLCTFSSCKEWNSDDSNSMFDCAAQTCSNENSSMYSSVCGFEQARKSPSLSQKFIKS
jgi:hypothetical protein